MSLIASKSTAPRASACFTLALMGALCLASPAFGQGKSELAHACRDAAHQWFENFNAHTNMRVDEPRVDGTRTAGGTINLGNYVAEIRCGFPANKLRLTEFYVDGVNKLKDLQSGRTFKD